jgi:hypothetical protein
MSSRFDYETRPKHAEEFDWMNDLIIDLKLQMLGEEPRHPVTIERLGERHEVVAQKLNRCRVQTVFS